MKKILATASAVVLSLAMVALPSITAMADDAESTTTVTTEPVTTEPVTTEPVTTEPVTTESTETEPTETQTESAAPETTVPETESTEPESTEPETEAFSARVAPSLSSNVAPTGDSDDKCEADYLKPDELDEPSGEYTLKDGDVVIGTLTWSGKTVVYDLEEGWSIDLCVKSGAHSTDDGTKVTYFLALIGEGQASILQDISHLEYRATYTPPEEDCDDVILGARGFSVSIDCPPDPLEVEVSGSATDQVCEASGDESPGTFVQGSIQLTVSDLDGVTKIEYSQNNGPKTEVDLNTLLIEDLAPGKYDFVVTVAVGYAAVADFSVTVKADNDPECKKIEICHWNEGGQGDLGSFNQIDVSVKSIINLPNGHAYHEHDIIPPFDYIDGNDIKSFPGLNYDPEAEGCGDYELPTEGPVMPQVKFTPATCDTDGSYTLISPAPTEGLPAKTVTWFVNGVETEPGTYPVAAGESVTVKVVANAPSYVLDYGLPGGFVTEYTYPAYEFTAPTACDLTTLALTGNDIRPALGVAGFLGLLGVALLRTARRRNRFGMAD